jgi:molybdate transport system substrate-binding protein
VNKHHLHRLAVLVLGLAWLPALQAAEIHIAVAANFTDATRDIIPLFEKASGHKVKASYGSTGKLYTQIEHGAPFQVFLAADSKRPQKAEATGLAVPGSRFTYARGQLVLWSAKADTFTDGEAYLKGLHFKRAAMANPKTAPYGLAAQQVMQHLGLWEQAKQKMVRGDSIAQTFQFVATGNTEAGFVAYSQVKAWKKGGGSLWVIPADYYAPIEQQAVLLQKGKDNAAARAFLDFLKSDAAHKVIEGYGYGLK